MEEINKASTEINRIMLELSKASIPEIAHISLNVGETCFTMIHDG